MAVQMELVRILIRETDDTHYLELKEQEGDRIFPIVIGLNEAAAIERRIMGQTPFRPQTHELLANVIDELGYQLVRVVISDLKNHTFYARLHLTPKDGNGGEDEGGIEIDSRPSDAIALGVATEVPIYVEEHVLDEVSQG